MTERKETPEERIDRLNKTLDEFLCKAKPPITICNNSILARFGLTNEEAKAGLKRESNFNPADEKKQHFRTDEEEPVPCWAVLIRGYRQSLLV